LIEGKPAHRKYRISGMQNRSASAQYYSYNEWLCGSWATRRE